MGKNSEKSEYRVLLSDIDGVLVSQADIGKHLQIRFPGL